MKSETYRELFQGAASNKVMKKPAEKLRFTNFIANNMIIQGAGVWGAEGDFLIGRRCFPFLNLQSFSVEERALSANTFLFHFRLPLSFF